MGKDKGDLMKIARTARLLAVTTVVAASALVPGSALAAKHAMKHHAMKHHTMKHHAMKHHAMKHKK
jgi:hypothetical protein